jgi:hypothetical protein
MPDEKDWGVLLTDAAINELGEEMKQYLNAWCELTHDGYPEGAPSR